MDYHSSLLSVLLFIRLYSLMLVNSLMSSIHILQGLTCAFFLRLYYITKYIEEMKLNVNKMK